MRVRQGWSGEHRPNQWGKIDVTCDETDLSRLINDAGLPQEVLTAITAKQSFLLLNYESQRDLIACLIAQYNYPQDKGLEEMASFQVYRDNILQQLRLTAVERGWLTVTAEPDPEPA